MSDPEATPDSPGRDAGSDPGPDSGRGPVRRRRLDESMSLLVDLSRDSLDPGYREAAARRAVAATDPGDGAPTEPGQRHHALLAAGVLGCTVLIVLAAVQAHLSAPAAARSRSLLAAEVTRQTKSVSELEREVAALRTETAQLRDTTLRSSSQGAALSRQLAAEEFALGTVAVAGPGLRVTLGDATASPGGGQGPNRVLDRDLQAVVNALWASGAEAVAIDGERLSAQSAIRQAGDAILVDFKPVTSPYDIKAVGDPVAMETAFGASAVAARMRSYVQLYGLRFAYHRAAHLTLPAATDVAVRYAHPIPFPTRKSPS